MNLSLSTIKALSIFHKFLVVLSTIVNLQHLLQRVLNGPEVSLFDSDKAKLFAEIFSKSSAIPLPASLSRTNLKLHNVLLTPTLFKKIITNLDPSKVSGPDRT